jgi:hypothetical protein
MVSNCCQVEMDEDIGICPECKEHAEPEYDDPHEAYDAGFDDGFQRCKTILNAEYYQKAKRAFLYWNKSKREISKDRDEHDLWLAYKSIARIEVDWMKTFNKGKTR